MFEKSELITEIESLLITDDIEDIEEFEIIEEGDWISDGKYEFSDTIIKYKGVLFCISQNRSGSYFTDYEYLNPTVWRVEAREVTKTIYVRI